MTNNFLDFTTPLPAQMLPNCVMKTSYVPNSPFS